MQKLTALNPISTPLNSVVLIEASAGTGKTYTIASLYLRLLLQAGENCFSQPLSVEQILVVTFTEAATQELKERIRHRIHLAKSQLSTYRATRDKAVFIDTDNEILAELVDSISDLNMAIHRLHIAEQNMDLAAIYTIHGFCRRLLTKYAFHSGIQFNLALVKDETLLLQQFCREFWREHFYPQPLLMAKFLQEKFTSPDEVLRKIRSYVQGESLQVETDHPHLLQQPLTTLFNRILSDDLEAIQALKQEWLISFEEISELLQQALDKKILNGKKFQQRWLNGWLSTVKQWAENQDSLLPAELFRFSQSNIDEACKNDGQIKHILFEKTEQFADLNNKNQINHKLILHHYIQWVRQKLINHKITHIEKSFNDLLRLADEALQSAQGEELADLIRHQYPFAMIDEFQDTDAMQYRIFSKLYTQSENTGFIMIGDPKQAIYKFRGADINSYLQAASQAKVRFNLDKNYRSCEKLIDTVNRFFAFDKNPPFLYEQIPFSSVGVGRKNLPQFSLNAQPQAALQVYLNDEKVAKAEICAEEICRLLREKAEFIGETRQFLQPQNIAVLVRDRYEADEIKQALQKRHIASVYLSDKNSVFDSPIASSLSTTLRACLHCDNEKTVLTALSGLLFVLDSQQLMEIKQNEALLEHWLEEVEHWQKNWKINGILPMLYQLLHRKSPNCDNSIAERLMGLPNGERLLTDVLHLAELLQQAAGQQESENALLVWFEKQIQQKEDLDEQRLRLESEQDLVKIVTIHKSKGLEYDVVWLPFMDRKLKSPQTDIATYYNKENQQIQWDMQSQHWDLVLQEQLAEEMRLLYVALTRAKYQLSLVLPTSLGDWSALVYALTEGECGSDIKLKTTYQTAQLVGNLKQKCQENAVEIISKEEISTSLYEPIEEKQTFTAERFSSTIEKDWQISSFTALYYSHQHNLAKQQNGNTQSAVGKQPVLHHYSEQGDEHFSSNPLEQNFTHQWEDYPQGYSPTDFPSGTNVGVLLHSFFEKQAFNQPIKKELTEKILTALQLDEQWQTGLNQWLNAIINNPLNEERLCLAQLSPAKCLKELQFYLKVKSGFSVEKFNRTLAQYHRFTETYYSFDHIKGMLRGFIDLVFYHQGKYYLLDYKSNLLGNSLEHYNQRQLTQIMQSQHYDLQYLLYCVALDRYLQLRHKNYDYKRDFGGVFYCFLRGMDGKTANQGVFFDKPDFALIQALGELFYA